MKKNDQKFWLEIIRCSLRDGKFLVVPSSLYKDIIEVLKKEGWAEEDYKNIYESKPIKAVSN